MSNPIDDQIDRLRAAVQSFLHTFGRVPTVAFDADGVIYDFEAPYIAWHNRCNPNLPPIVGPFEKFDVGYGQTPEVAEALQESMRTLDWSELEPYEEARVVLRVLVEVGLDLSIATAHRVDNTYSPAAKVYQFDRDFDGYFNDRIQVGIDKTRVVADFLIDDKPEVSGKLQPMWDHLRFTQRYNRDLPGIHVSWETMFEVLASVIEAKVSGRTLTPIPAPAIEAALPALGEDKTTDEPETLPASSEALLGSSDAVPGWAHAADEPDAPVITDDSQLGGELESLPMPMPWVEEDALPEAPTVEGLTWESIIGGGEKK